MLFSGVFGVSLFGDILTIYIKWLDVQYGVSCNTAGLLNHVVRVCVCVCVCVCVSVCECECTTALMNLIWSWVVV